MLHAAGNRLVAVLDAPCAVVDHGGINACGRVESGPEHPVVDVAQRGVCPHAHAADPNGRQLAGGDRRGGAIHIERVVVPRPAEERQDAFHPAQIIV